MIKNNYLQSLWIYQLILFAHVKLIDKRRVVQFQSKTLLLQQLQNYIE